MQPELVAEFCAAFMEEWNRLAAEASAGAGARQRALQVIERKLANLVEAIADGLKATGLQQKLADLEARRAELFGTMAAEVPAIPAPHPNLAQVYAERVAELRRALDADDGVEVLEVARTLIDTVVVSPPDDPGEPPTIELTGNFIAMLKAGGANLAPDNATLGACLTGLLSSSAKEGARGSFLPLPSPVDRHQARHPRRILLAQKNPPIRPAPHPMRPVQHRPAAPDDRPIRRQQ